MAQDFPPASDTHICLISMRDGYKLQGVYKKYHPSIARHEIEILIGGAKARTTILFPKDILERWTVIEE